MSQKAKNHNQLADSIAYTVDKPTEKRYTKTTTGYSKYNKNEFSLTHPKQVNADSVLKSHSLSGHNSSSSIKTSVCMQRNTRKKKETATSKVFPPFLAPSPPLTFET
jgi:hypothetical protein